MRYILYKRDSNGRAWYLESYIHDSFEFTNDINKALRMPYHEADRLISLDIEIESLWGSPLYLSRYYMIPERK